MSLHTFSNVSLIVVVILAVLNIIFYNTLELGSVSIINNKKTFKLTDINDIKFKFPYISSIVIIILSIVIYILKLFKTRNPIFSVVIILLSISILILSIVSIVYFANIKLNNSYNFNIGEILNMKENKGNIVVLQVTTYVFFGLAIISSVLSGVSSKLRTK
jgi:hypothetical protein